MLLHGESVHSVSLTYFLFLKFQLVCLVCCVLYVVFILVPLFLFRLLFFLCSSSVCLSFFGFCSLCRGGEFGVCACHGYIFFPSVSIFRFPLLLVPRRGVEFKASLLVAYLWLAHDTFLPARLCLRCSVLFAV